MTVQEFSNEINSIIKKNPDVKNFEICNFIDDKCKFKIDHGREQFGINIAVLTNTMPSIKGHLLDNSFVTSVSAKIDDLIYYEGPLLSLYIDKYKPDQYYLYKWADTDQSVNRWLVIPINRDLLAKFFSRLISLKQLIIESVPEIICIDIDGNLNIINTIVALTSDIPTRYLPDDKLFFFEENYTEFANKFKHAIIKS